MFNSGTLKPQSGMRVNWGYPITDGMLACWVFNEFAGKIRNYGKLEQTELTLTGSNVVWSPTGKTIGASINYIATTGTSYLASGNTTDFDFERTDPFTLEIMYWPASTSVAGACGNGNAGGTRGIFIKPNNSASKVQIYFTNNGTSNWIIADSTDACLTQSEWNHIVITYTGSSTVAGLQLYVNGVNYALTATADALSATIKTGVEWTVGRPGANTTGSISGDYYGWHRIWNRPLTPDEVWDLYNSPWEMFGPSQIWFFGADAASTYNDAMALGVRAGVSTSAVVAEVATVSLDSRLGFTPAVNQLAEGSITLGSREGISFVAEKVYEDAIALGVRLGISQAVVVDVAGPISLGVRQGLSLQAAWEFSGPITLGVRQGLSYTTDQTLVATSGFVLPVGFGPTGNLDMSPSGAFGVRAGLSFIVGLNLNDTMALDSRLGLAMAVLLTQEPALSLGARVGYSPAGNLVINADIPLATLQGLSLAPTQDVGAAVTLGGRVGLAISANLVIDTSFPIGSRLGSEFDVTVDLGAATTLGAGLGLSESVGLTGAATVTFGASLGQAIAVALEAAGSLSIPVRVGLSYGSDVTAATHPGTLTLTVTEINALTNAFTERNLLSNAISAINVLTSTESTLP